MRTKNHFELRGFVGNDPELKTLESGRKVLNLRIATAESYSDKKTSETIKTTDWHSVTLWGKLAEISQKYVNRGALVSVEGRIKPTSYDKNGEIVYKVDLVVDTLDIILNNKEEE